MPGPLFDAVEERCVCGERHAEVVPGRGIGRWNLDRLRFAVSVFDLACAGGWEFPADDDVRWGVRFEREPGMDGRFGGHRRGEGSEGDGEGAGWEEEGSQHKEVSFLGYYRAATAEFLVANGRREHHV